MKVVIVILVVIAIGALVWAAEKIRKGPRV